MHRLARVLIVALALTASGCYATVRTTGVRTTAHAGGTIRVASAPPSRPVFVDPGPPPVQQAIWVDGHHEWNGNVYVWVDGYWLEPRQDCQFIQPSWQRQGSHWVYDAGGCRQRDGVVVVPPRRGQPGTIIVSAPPPRGGGTVVVTPPDRPRGGGVVVIPPRDVAPPPDRGGGTVVVTPPDRGGGTVVVTPPRDQPRGGGTVVVAPPPDRGGGGVVVAPPPPRGGGVVVAPPPPRGGGAVVVAPPRADVGTARPDVVVAPPRAGVGTARPDVVVAPPRAGVGTARPDVVVAPPRAEVGTARPDVVVAPPRGGAVVTGPRGTVTGTGPVIPNPPPDQVAPRVTVPDPEAPIVPQGSVRVRRPPPPVQTAPPRDIAPGSRMRARPQ